MREISGQLKHLWDEEEEAVLATIIDVQGSAYQKEGGQALIFPSGDVVGIISGGCVESDLTEYAKLVLEEGRAKKLSYDFRWSEDDVFGLGVGCDGIVTVFLQPFSPKKNRHIAEQLVQASQRRLQTTKSYLANTIVESSDEKRYPLGFEWQEEAETEYTSSVKNVTLNGAEVSIFQEYVQPLPHLVIIGAGADAGLLAQGAIALNWRVSVVTQSLTPLSKSFHLCEHIPVQRGEYGRLDLEKDAFVVIMTHNLELDFLALQVLLPLKFNYLGLLGSRKRRQLLLDQLSKQGTGMDELLRINLYSPVGLDIGAKTPEEITVSILSELIAVREKRHIPSRKYVSASC